MRLKISEMAGKNMLFFSGKLFTCLGVVMGYFSDLQRLNPGARHKVTLTSIQKR